jgi:pyruvate/2-oxoglutarate/acetoin dehydrogenase E1 component
VAELTIVQALNQALDQAMERDARVMVLGEDVGRGGGVFRVTAGLQERYGEDRVVDAPVAESGIVGTAVGLAIAGMRPVVELQFMGFSYPALDQVISHVARMRNRSRGRFTVPMVIRIPYGRSGGADHHSDSAEALYAHTAGLKVVAPSGPRDAKGLLLAAIHDHDPVVFLEPIRLYRSVKEEVPEEPFTEPIGAARVVREGRDATVMAYGRMVHEARSAADALASEHGVEAEVVDLRTLVPLDVETLAASVKKTGLAVVVHEAPRTGGFGAEVAASIQERAHDALRGPILRVTGWDTAVPLKRLEDHYFPNAARIARAVLAALAPRPG